MASAIHTYQTVTGETIRVKRKKQGRHKADPDMNKTAAIILHVTKAEKAAFVNAQKNSGFSQSFFGGLALSIGIKQLSDSDNC